MNTNEIELNFKYKEFFDPKFDWSSYKSYKEYLNNDEFMDLFKDNVNWWNISEFYGLSDSFIEKYKDRLNWNILSQYRILSEDLIEKYKDRVNWRLISSYQKLSLEFLIKFKKRTKYAYKRNENISIETKNEFFKVLNGSKINEH